MPRLWTLTFLFALSLSASSLAADPAETVRKSEQVLADLVAIPAKQIPQSLLARAQGIAVIPDVTKIGFIAGVRRGHGVVMVRDAEGEWSLPQFITLTGGSVGWQAGIQGTDVVLVFKSRKGVDGLMRGKFTIGADASVSAGPVGRNAEAATDTEFKAEILSYSRSRGLFAGVAIDGSALEIDQYANGIYYGSSTVEAPARLPESAAQLRNYLVELSQPAVAAPPAAPAGEPAQPIQPKTSPRRLDALRRSLVQNAGHLHAFLSPEWRQYLALPRELADPSATPSLESLTTLEERFAKVSSGAGYRDLADRPEFQTTHEVLQEYIAAMSASGPTLRLPPPPK